MMESVMNPGMCRCCASEGAFKDIKSTYHWMGEEEIYADMLRECFDIILNASEQGQDGGICEVCITQLRNAINFKKQVLHTEDQFQKHLQNKTLFRPNIVKVEVQAEEDSDDNMGSGDEGFSGAEFEVPIKTEVDDPKPKKRAAAKAPATTTRASAKKAKADNGETSTKRIPQADTVEIKIEVEPDEVKKEEITQPEIAGMSVANTKAARSSCKPVVSKGYGAEIYKHKKNIIEIMRWSNATPIKLWGDMGYMCCYCEDQYLDPADLKTHTLKDHEDVTKAFFIKNMCMYNYIIKLDITDLQCNICHNNIDTFEELMDHLKKHKKIIHTDIKNHIVPFKFGMNPLECFICKNVFNKFKLLLMHMNIHYRNYVCDICDAGYVNYNSLKIHKTTHQTENFNCSSCSMKFDTLAKRNQHVKTKHSKIIRHKCGYCKERFNEYRKKEDHLITVHGLQKQKSKCQACDKEFEHRKHLAVHVKRHHLMVRPHACELCEKKFFSASELRSHMSKHTGEKPYKCVICLKSYGQSRTLTAHMRIHNDDRRFKCERCGQAFVQKSSWRCHMKSKHGESV